MSETPATYAGDAIRAEQAQARQQVNNLLTQIAVRDNLIGGAGINFWRAVLAQVGERLGEVVE